MRDVRVPWVLPLIVLLLVALAPVSAQHQTPYEMLREALRAGGLDPSSNLSYTATCESETHDPFATGATPSKARYVERVDARRQRRRIDYQAPGQLLDIVVLEDSSNVYQWNTRLGVALRQDTKAGAMLPAMERERLDHLMQNYTVTVVGRDKVAGRDCIVVEILPIRQGNPWRRIWIDQEKLLPLRTENTNGAGFLTHTMVVSRIEYAVPNDPQMFQLPPDTIIREDPVKRSIPLPITRVGVEAGFEPVEPGYLPAGYTFAGAQAIRADHTSVIHLMYFDGLSTISLFEEQAAVGARGGGPDWIPADVGASGLRWVLPRSGLAFTLIGDVLPQELDKVKESIR